MESMDPYYSEFQKELVMSNPISILQAGPSGASQPHEITFNFSCKCRYERWIIPQDSAELQFLEDIDSQSTLQKSMRCDVPRISEFQKIKLWAAVSEGIEDFPLSRLDRVKLSREALNIAWDILAKPRPQYHLNPHYHLKLQFNVRLVRCQVFDEHGYIDWVRQQGLEAAMVPATDASIDSLRSKTIQHSNEDRGSCVVCLEDFEAGCDGVGRLRRCSNNAVFAYISRGVHHKMAKNKPLLSRLRPPDAHGVDS